MMIAAQVGDLGMSTSFIKLASSNYQTSQHQSLEYFKAIFKGKVYLATFIFIIGGLISIPLSRYMFQGPQYAFHVFLTFGATFFYILSHYASASLQVEGKVKMLSLSKIIPPAIKFIFLLVLFATNHLSLLLVLLGFFLVPISSFIIGGFAATKKFLYTKTNSLQRLSEIFKYSKWILIATVATTAIGQVDVLMVRTICGVDELVILIGGQKLASALPLITLSLVTILLPKVSSMKNSKELNYYFRKTLLLLPCIVLLLLIGLPLAKYIIPFFLGEKYINAIPVFQIYFVGFGIGLFITPLSLILYRLNLEYVFAWLNLTQLALNIVGNYLIISRYGAIGAASISVLLSLLAVIITLWILFKHGISNYRETDRHMTTQLEEY